MKSKHNKILAGCLGLFLLLTLATMVPCFYFSWVMDKEQRLVDAEIERDPAPPKLQPDQQTYRPQFVLDSGSIHAGKAFFVHSPSCPRPLVLTALHLFGPPGGHDQQLNSRQIAKQLRATRLRGARKPFSWILEQGALVIKTPQLVDGEIDSDGAGDIAILPAPGVPQLATFALADSAPALGESIWMVMPGDPREGGAPVLRRAVVDGETFGDMSYTFVEKVGIAGSSGAPMINAAGEIVAIQLGGGDFGERTSGYGNATAEFLPHLLEACAAKP